MNSGRYKKNILQTVSGPRNRNYPSYNTYNSLRRAPSPDNYPSYNTYNSLRRAPSPDNYPSYNTYNNSLRTTPPRYNNPSIIYDSNSLPTASPRYNNPSIIYDSNSLPTASPTSGYNEGGSPPKKRKREPLSSNPSNSFVDDAPSTPTLSSVKSPPPQTPPKVKIHDKVAVYTPSSRNKHLIKKQQTKLKDSPNEYHLSRDDTVSTLGGDSRIQKFETILQKLEMVLVDLLKNTQRLGRV